MSSRVVRLPLLLLLSAALAAAHVRPGAAEGDPLPPDLLDPGIVSSLHDLGVAGNLQEGEEPRASDAHPGRYTRSLIEPERALIAECKVRTEVQEVTRDMHDRRNANFLLWPLCVEVQRCSGCCNSHTMQCVPVLTRTRYLKVRKIQYVNFKSEVGDVVVSVEDHVTCRCQNRGPPRPPPPVPPPAPQPPPIHPVTPPKTPTSKAELHRHDDQKHNQRPAQEGGGPWALAGGYTQLARWTPRPPPPVAAYTLAAAPNAAATTGARPQGPPDIGAPQGSGSEGGPFLPRHPHHPHPHLHHHPHPHHLHPPHPPQVSPEPGMRYTLISFQADSASTQPADHKPERNPSPSPSAATTNQKELALVPARVDHDGQAETAPPANHNKAPEQEESGSTISGEGAGLPASPVQSQDSGPAPPHPHPAHRLPPHPHPADPQHRPQPTASHTGVSLQGTPGRTPAPGGRTPRRPATRRRRRKHRNRISKNAIRAIIM